MTSNSLCPKKTPPSLRGVGSVLFLPGFVGLATLPWHESLRRHGLSTGFDSFLEANGHSVSALWIVGLFDLAAIAIGIACFRGSRGIRWAVPAFLGCLSVFGFMIGRPWEGTGSAIWFFLALFFLLRSVQMADYFNTSGHVVGGNGG